MCYSHVYVDKMFIAYIDILVYTEKVSGRIMRNLTTTYGDL